LTTVVAVSIIIPLTVALTAATVALFSKHLDTRNLIEQRHSERRLEAYDHLLTAGDAAWNCIARKAVAELDHEDGPSEEEFRKVFRQCEKLLQSGLDQLKAHSHDFDAIQPILAEYYVTIFDSAELPWNVGAGDYERVRTKLVECRRRESGLKKRLQGARGQSWRERRTALREAQESTKGITNVFRDVDNEVEIIQGDGAAIMYHLNKVMQHNNEFRASITQTQDRLDAWREKGIWKSSDV